MKTFYHRLLFAVSLLLIHGHLRGQSVVTASLRIPNSETNSELNATKSVAKQKIVIITGTRFAYPLVQKWIDDYNAINPSIQIVIESRGSSDPTQYDILIEASEPNEELKKTREYLYIARYAILPVANSKAAFSKIYSEKGLTRDLFTQLFFHDLYADKEKEQTIHAPYTIYTRLQKAGAPIVFTNYFGYQQKDIKGKAIAGSDEHLLKALLRDSIGVSYLPLTLIYDHASKKPIPGITVLPVDLNDNGRVTNEEKIYDNLEAVITRFESNEAKELNNVPIAYIHLSVDKQTASLEAVDFLRWVLLHGQEYVHAFGYLTAEPKRIDKEGFEQFAVTRIKQ